MLSLACAVFNWPVLLFIFGVFLAFFSLIVGGIAWAFSWVLNVPGWKVLCVETIVLGMTAVIFWPLGYEGESGFFLSLLGAAASLLLMAASLLSRRFTQVAESSAVLKPYSFNVSPDSPIPDSTAK